MCAYIFISCVIPGFLFVIVVVDDEMEAMSRSSFCVQKRNENDTYKCNTFSDVDFEAFSKAAYVPLMYLQFQ